jgi:hypothetical protein
MSALLMLVSFPHVLLATLAGAAAYAGVLVVTGGIRIERGSLRVHL